MNVIDLIKRQEGFSPNAYDDATGRLIAPGYTLVGHPTVGYGIALDTGGITEEEATWLMRRRVSNILLDLGGMSWTPELNDVRLAAVASMAYQLGISGLMGFRQMIRALDRLDYEEAAKQALLSKWAVQTPERAKEIAEMLRSGKWPEEVSRAMKP